MELVYNYFTLRPALFSSTACKRWLVKPCTLSTSSPSLVTQATLLAPSWSLSALHDPRVQFRTSRSYDNISNFPSAQASWPAQVRSHPSPLMHLALPHHHLCQLGSLRQPWSQPIFAQFQLSTHVKVSRLCHQILEPCALKNTAGIRFCLQKV